MAGIDVYKRQVYLCLSYDAIAARLGDLTARGVTFAPGQTLRDLYQERCPLYERYAHSAVCRAGLSPAEIVQSIVQQL